METCRVAGDGWSMETCRWLDPGADHEQDLKWGQEVWLWKRGYFLDQDFDEEGVWT